MEILIKDPKMIFIEPPINATVSLLNAIDRTDLKFKNEIWEPACGDGAISKVLEQRGYVVNSTDLIDRGYGSVLDFLHPETKSLFKGKFDIITNPPYCLAESFVRTAVEYVDQENGKVAMLLKLSFLEGKSRQKMFKETPLWRVFVFSKRISFGTNEREPGPGMLAYAWFVWDKSYKGLPTIDWI